MSANLSGLAIGSLTINPPFDGETTAYTVNTINATNTVTVTPADSGAEVSIKNGEAAVKNGEAATWGEGENTLTVTVKNGTATKTYVVTVNKS